MNEFGQGVEPAAAGEAFRIAPLLIPVYRDSRAKDLDWAEISKLQERVYGKKQRIGGEAELGTLLRIWDDVHVRGKKISEIASDLRTAVSTVKSRYEAVNQIIMNGLEEREADIILDALPQVATTIDNCPACITRINQGDRTLCPIHEKLVSVDTTYQRELQMDPRDLDSYDWLRGGSQRDDDNDGGT